ncbi:secretory carrier-associated membrane protein 4 isoform X2 [Chelonia mydas]|uniref:secretory carrier-associated membrane protein 4 isoform X2 n=2 Tax=Chelonia mydas TaxID=8469 RepID=UPI001CA80BDB|nr:secretory carrier-associated membrane protein 4 isoform X2 [Chelonia mydas]
MTPWAPRGMLGEVVILAAGGGGHKPSWNCNSRRAPRLLLRPGGSGGFGGWCGGVPGKINDKLGVCNNDSITKPFQSTKEKCFEVQANNIHCCLISKFLQGTFLADMAEKVNNFPPLPKFIPLKPCFYQNFADEIPIDYQSLVKRIYHLWIFYCITLVVNLIGCLAWWIGGGYGVNFGLAILWLFLFSPCSYVCWFRPAYKGFRSDSSFNFMAFFFIFGAQFVLTVIQAIGFSGWGACGWLAATTFFSTSVAAAVFMLFPAILFTVSAVAMSFYLLRVHKIYRGAGGSFQKAQDEWNSGSWRDPPSREAQYNNFSGNSLPQYPTVPNYPTGNQWP